MLIKDDIIEFLKNYPEIAIPVTYVAKECGCTSAYVSKVCRQNNSCEIEKRKYGRLYVTFKVKK